MSLADGQPRRQTLIYGYEVVRFDRTSESTNSCITMQHIGSYDAFARAKAVAHKYLEFALVDYYRRKQPVGYFNEITLERSGSIVVYKERPANGNMANREIVVSEFRVILVNILDQSWQVESRIFGEKFSLLNNRVPYIGNEQSSSALPPASRNPDQHEEPVTSIHPAMQQEHVAMPESAPSSSFSHYISNMQGATKEMPILGLPGPPDQHKEPVTPSNVAGQEEHVTSPEPTPPSSQVPPMGPQYDQEIQPDWARTRIPLFDLRDDGPFRRPGDKPYAHTMVLLSPPPTLSGHSGPQDSRGIWSEVARAVV